MSDNESLQSGPSRVAQTLPGASLAESQKLSTHYYPSGAVKPAPLLFIVSPGIQQNWLVGLYRFPHSTTSGVIHLFESISHCIRGFNLLRHVDHTQNYG
jgi:hypothetical protein